MVASRRAQPRIDGARLYTLLRSIGLALAIGRIVVSGDATHEFGRPARFASNNFGAVLTSALAGSGIALISDFMVGEMFSAGTLVRVLPEWTTRPTEVNAVYPAREKLPPRLSLFIDHLAQSLNPPPWVA